MSEFFKELQHNIESTSNSNFHFDKLDWPTKVWIKGLCDLLEQKNNKLLNHKQAKRPEKCNKCMYYGKAFCSSSCKHYPPEG